MGSKTVKDTIWVAIGMMTPLLGHYNKKTYSITSLVNTSGAVWETVEHVYSDYPCGMRKLAVISRGKDSQFWAGHYGAKFGGTEVIVTFPDNPRELSPEDYPDEEKKYRSKPSQRPLRSLRVPVGIRGRFPARRGH
ncbi:F-box associated region [Trichostrongylus colubriformis]|uniref:F-box associated region n=1 Tax=Trichostrongylus colubriformis TaxID=6319 RepID=A0AAN8FXC7_TRICO